MILSTYDYGDETPATQLTPRQLRAALADRGGTLWVDVRAPTDADAAVLATSLRLPPPVVAWLCHAAPRPDVPPADNVTVATLVDVGGELDIVLGPNLVVTRDRGSRSHAEHLAPAGAAPPLQSGADGLAAHLVRLGAANLEAASATLSGTVAAALTDAARRPGEAGTALHTVQRRAAALADAVAADQAAAHTLRAAGQVRDAARTALDGVLVELADTASDVQAAVDRVRSAAPSAELLALAAIARDIAFIKWAMIIRFVLRIVVIIGLVGWFLNGMPGWPR
ncbi:MAG: hypothetical protein IPG72_11360 [Ardenticatenales bacterium]|jgi:hypothetical protein|nr:hypothetical protein [Ardenticatenales bacterium]